MLYMYEYYKVDGFAQKYALYTDALNKALVHYAGWATRKIKRCVEVTENKQTAEKYNIINEVE